jgi:hypothetical protein
VGHSHQRGGGRQGQEVHQGQVVESTVANGRLFGRITQKGPNKKKSGRTKKLWMNFGRFWTKGRELLKKLVFFLLFSLFLCKSKKYYTFPKQVDTDNEIFMSPNAFKKSNLVGAGFFLSGRIFPPDWSENLPRVGDTGLIQHEEIS